MMIGERYLNCLAGSILNKNDKKIGNRSPPQGEGWNLCSIDGQMYKKEMRNTLLRLTDWALQKQTDQEDFLKKIIGRLFNYGILSKGIKNLFLNNFKYIIFLNIFY